MNRRFRGPSTEKCVLNTPSKIIDTKQLKKIKVEIKRKITGLVKQLQELDHSYARPEEIKIYRGRGEGKHPIFQREDIVVNKEDSERRSVSSHSPRRSPGTHHSRPRDSPRRHDSSPGSSRRNFTITRLRSRSRDSSRRSRRSRSRSGNSRREEDRRRNSRSSRDRDRRPRDSPRRYDSSPGSSRRNLTTTRIRSRSRDSSSRSRRSRSRSWDSRREEDRRRNSRSSRDRDRRSRSPRYGRTHSPRRNISRSAHMDPIALGMTPPPGIGFYNPEYALWFPTPPMHAPHPMMIPRGLIPPRGMYRAPLYGMPPPRPSYMSMFNRAPLKSSNSGPAEQTSNIT